MKIKPTTYAQLLIETLTSVISTHPEPAGGRIEGGEKSHDTGNKFYPIVKGFWYFLQKNKQYRDLPKILDELEKVYAAKEGFAIAHVESGRELSQSDLAKIQQKLGTFCHSEQSEESHRQDGKKILHSVQDDKKIIIKSKVNPSVTGIIAKINGKVIDLTIEDKISKLRKEFNK